MKIQFKKSLSLLLTVLMLLSCMPVFASAAELITPVISVVPTATELEAGTRLNRCTLSGGIAVDPTTGEEVEGVWSWVSARTKVSANGYFQAYFAANNNEIYVVEPVIFYVLVKVIGDTSEPEIPEDMVITGEVSTWPTIADVEWKVGMTVADLVLTGGEATVAGKFSIETSSDTLVVPGENSVRIEFTPDNANAVMLGNTTNTVTYNANVAMKDIEVSVDPDYVYTYEYGTQYLLYIAGNASYYGITTNLPEDITVKASASKAIDANGNEVNVKERYLAPGNYTVTVYVSAEPVNIEGIGRVQLYNPQYVEIPVVITKKASTTPFGTLSINGTTNGEGQSSAGIYYKYNNVEGVNGHCVLKVNGETVVDNIPVTATTYTFTTETSGKFTAILEYIPAENDYVEFETTVLTQEFELEVLEKEEDLGGLLPGGDGDSGITLPEIDLGDFELDADGDHKFKFVNIIQNLIEMLKNFIKQIGQTIEGIL